MLEWNIWGRETQGEGEMGTELFLSDIQIFHPRDVFFCCNVRWTGFKWPRRETGLHVIIPGEEKVLVEDRSRNGRSAAEEKSLVDVVYALRDEVQELKQDNKKMKRSLEEEQRARKDLEKVVRRVLKSMNDPTWDETNLEGKINTKQEHEETAHFYHFNIHHHPSSLSLAGRRMRRDPLPLFTIIYQDAVQWYINETQLCDTHLLKRPRPRLCLRPTENRTTWQVSTATAYYLVQN
ncbi:hypothetical protein INR49_010213 [Caranx melampygus]|nr:hypothetical protein INR49_010213 [Caranx melampygus]